VTVRNVSEQGMQLRCEQAIRPGTVVFLTGERYECLGTVRYCVHHDDGYRIGLEFVREPYLRNPAKGGVV
jgi:hypothetical protein